MERIHKQYDGFIAGSLLGLAGGAVLGLAGAYLTAAGPDSPAIVRPAAAFLHRTLGLPDQGGPEQAGMMLLEIFAAPALGAIAGIGVGRHADKSASRQTPEESEMNAALGSDMQVEFTAQGNVHALLRTDQASNYFRVDRRTGESNVMVGRKQYVLEQEVVGRSGGMGHADTRRTVDVITPKWVNDHCLPYSAMTAEQKTVVDTICSRIGTAPCDPERRPAKSPADALRRTLPAAENAPVARQP